MFSVDPKYYADLGRNPGWTDYVKQRIEEIEREEPGFREAVRRIVVAENQRIEKAKNDL
jgi:hypothetical protein